MSLRNMKNSNICCSYMNYYIDNILTLKMSGLKIIFSIITIALIDGINKVRIIDAASAISLI